MRLLLDTHILLWVITNDSKLPKSIRAAIINADNVFVSMASLWECAVKISIKKLSMDFEKILKAIDASGFEMLSIKPEHLSELLDLPMHHKDPFDRLLIAQALSEPLILQSVDPLVLAYFEA